MKSQNATVVRFVWKLQITGIIQHNYHWPMQLTTISYYALS